MIFGHQGVLEHLGRGGQRVDLPAPGVEQDAVAVVLGLIRLTCHA